MNKILDIYKKFNEELDSITKEDLAKLSRDEKITSNPRYLTSEILAIMEEKKILSKIKEFKEYFDLETQLYNLEKNSKKYKELDNKLDELYEDMLSDHCFYTICYECGKKTEITKQLVDSILKLSPDSYKLIKERDKKYDNI